MPSNFLFHVLSIPAILQIGYESPDMGHSALACYGCPLRSVWKVMETYLVGWMHFAVGEM